jgi:hypothetical protein
MPSTFTTTTLEYLLALKRYSDFDVSYVHATHDATLDFELNAYDVVFQNYCVRLCFEDFVSRSYREALKRFRGLKVLSVQDDYDRTSTLHRAIRELGFHVLLTCIQPEFWPQVYPQNELPGLQIVLGMTGYMPEGIAERIHPVPLEQRRIVIGYRGRDIGGRYGRLGFEKYEIGRRIKEICESRGISHSIAMNEQSRIYGDAWYDFIGSCRVMLGSESASNVFDFDGSIERKYEELSKERGGPVPYEEFRPYIEHIEKNFNVGQISPRIFEYAVMRTPMVLFKGRYSDVIRPDEHYIALEKDFSNVDEILERIEDMPALESMATRAYDHLVASGRYSHRAFARKLQSVIEKRYDVLMAGQFNVQSAAANSGTQVKRKITSPGDALRRLVLLERPTEMPGSLDDFKARQRCLSLPYREDELPRLNEFYAENMARCMREIRRLKSTYELTKQLRCRKRAAKGEHYKALIRQKICLDEGFRNFEAHRRELAHLRRLALAQNDHVALQATLECQRISVETYIERRQKDYCSFVTLYNQTVQELTISRYCGLRVFQILTALKDYLASQRGARIRAGLGAIDHLPIISSIARVITRASSSKR